MLHMGRGPRYFSRIFLFFKNIVNTFQKSQTFCLRSGLVKGSFLLVFKKLEEVVDLCKFEYQKID